MVFFAIAAAVFSVSRAAPAAPRVVVPADCGTAEEFEAELRRRFEREVYLPSIALTITPAPAAEPARYHLHLSVAQETRELEDSDCRALFRAAVVVTATIVLSESEAEPSAPPPAPVAAPPPAPPAPSSVEAPEARRAFRLGGSLGAGVSVGLVPQAAPAFTLEGRALFAPGFGFGLAGHYVTEESYEDDAGRGVTVDAWGGRAFGLYQPIPYLLTGLGASASKLNGTGQGSGGRSDSAWAAGPTAGLWFVPLPRLPVWLAVGGELYWNVLRPVFAFDNYGEIFSSSRFTASLFLSVGLHQP